MQSGMRPGGDLQQQRDRGGIVREADLIEHRGHDERVRFFHAG